jgi:hypothetical protein
MKKFLVATLGLFCASLLVVSAQDAAPAAPKKDSKPAKHEQTAEQKAIQKEMLDKYDANKDGKIDKDERAKMTQEDKDKFAKVRGGGKKKAQ